MIVTRTAVAAFTAEFESERELRDEHRTNLSLGGLRLPTEETVAAHTVLTVTLRGPWGSDADVKATVVAQLPDGIAVVIDGDTSTLVELLLTKPTNYEEVAGRRSPVAGAAAIDSKDSAKAAAPETGDQRPATGTDGDADEKDQKTSWDRVRGRSQMEKLMLAVRADRTERAVLVQDNDPRVLLSVLRNPRLTVDEVVRIAKSPFLNFQIVDVIMKTGQWMASLDVRLALIHNPKTPQAFALRILPTLPDNEVRSIARAGTNMALKQAAVRRIQGKPS